MTRHFFRCAHEQDRPPRVPRPQHRRRIVLGQRTEPNGKLTLRTMSSREAAMQMGRSRGGTKAHATGKAYEWDSESARKAARRAWATRWRMNRKIGKRLGRPAKNRPAVDHKALRERYATGMAGHAGDHIIWFSPATSTRPACWWDDLYGYGNKRISERTALIRLGHLPPKTRHRGFIPESITPVPPVGTKRATR